LSDAWLTGVRRGLKGQEDVSVYQTDQVSTMSSMGSGSATREGSRGVESPERDDERRCESCGGGVGAVGPEETTSGERITRTLPTESGNGSGSGSGSGNDSRNDSGTRLVEYCSPSCFIRHVADVTGAGQPGD